MNSWYYIGTEVHATGMAGTVGTRGTSSISSTSWLVVLVVPAVPVVLEFKKEVGINLHNKK